MVDAECNKIFKVATDFENLQRILPQYFPYVHIKSCRSDTAVVEEHLKIAGKELVLMTKHVTKYPETHKVFVIGGAAKGSHISETYESIQEGTKISVEADFKLRGKLGLSSFFVKNKIKNDLIKILDELAKVAEKQT